MMGQKEDMKDKRVIVFGPHPDDIDFACSGTMALWARDGAEIYYVICTNGEKGGDGSLEPDVLIEIRKNEQRKAAATVGVKDVIFLGGVDGELQNNKEFRAEIVRVLRQLKPQIVFSFDPANTSFDNFYRFHPDHRAMGLAVFDSIYPAVGNHFFFPHLLKEGLEPHKISEVYFFSTTKPNTWIDITSAIHLKLSALSCHGSQLSGAMDEIEALIKQRASEAGQRAKEIGKKRKLRYAEEFRVLAVPP